MQPTHMDREGNEKGDMDLAERRVAGTVPDTQVEPCFRADLRVDPLVARRRAGSMALLRGEFRALAILCLCVGILLLLEEIGVVDGVHRLWPVFPAVVGFGFLLLFFQRSRADLVLMGTGSYLIGVSVLFLICNYTSWSILVRLWPVFIAMVGVSSILASLYAIRIRRVMWMSGTFLMLLSIVFLIVFGLHPGLWPISLVLFGLWILLITWARNRTGRKGG